jgi:hypothetical protein
MCGKMASAWLGVGLLLELGACAGLEAGGAGLGSGFGYPGYQGYQPYQGFQLQQPQTQNCVMQQDPIGGISGPTYRMHCY